MFAYPCPTCAQRLTAPHDRIGEPTSCAACQGVFTIPSPDAVGIDTLTGVTVTPLPASAGDSVLVVATALASFGRHFRPLPASAGESVLVADHAGTAEAEYESAFEPAVPLWVAEPEIRTARPDSDPTSRRSFADTDSGRVILNPTGQYAVDIAAELSAVLTMRMPPPPEPMSDRQLTMAAWLTGSAAAAGLWLAGVATAPGLFPFVALVGAAMIAFGLLWRAYLAGRRDGPSVGLMTLLPPVAAVRLFVPTPTHGLRPLRFVLAGGVFLGLFVLGPAVRAVFEGEFGSRIAELPSSHATTPAGRFQKAVEAEKYDDALAELRHLPGPDGVAPNERTGTLRGVIALTTADRADLRTAALTALADWSPADAKEATRAALTAADRDERRAACRVSDRVLGADAAPRLAECLTDHEQRADAKAALLRLGVAAESAVLPLLNSAREPVALVACEVLEKVGGANSLAALTELAAATRSRAVRQEASQAAETVGERLRRGR